jgi:hypothetical protein
VEEVEEVEEEEEEGGKRKNNAKMTHVVVAPDVGGAKGSGSGRQMW